MAGATCVAVIAAAGRQQSTGAGEEVLRPFDVRGTEGALSWDFRRMGELRVCLEQDYQDATWETRLVRPGASIWK